VGSHLLRDDQCIYCGSVECRYGACQHFNSPESALWRGLGQLCGECYRPLELKERWHDILVAMSGGNFVTKAVCADCAGLVGNSETGLGRWGPR